ncbi:zinc-binding dehydrogenase [Actinomadura barringtoniae]|uniref:Zinc-binding dehydrogenase n=1 Tax=Actinomadura barringtoniae TaxID=1427535 RepID=A0A939PHW8_9ACTN|nr:zinc-binding dehydrogenase [Actinomadura barringtoniae]MBO2453011.1 zinc-binding dehydrogenase [Actinomadura barringtoniae]
MKVIEAASFGGPEVLVAREEPEPNAGPGEVVVRVAAVDTLFVDTRIRSGWGGEFFGITAPYIPGGGLSGEVIAAGDGVPEDLVGSRVATYTNGLGGKGGYAERVAVSADAVIPLPDEVGLNDAASLIHDGVTGMRLMENVAIKPGERVLVVGATGGMGILLVQLARAAGAQVIAAARGAEKLKLARELGADVTVDYSEPGWAERVLEATGGHGADVVLDGVGDEIGRAAFDATAEGGRFSAHGATISGFTELDPQEVERRRVTLYGIGDVQLDLAERQRLAAAALAEVAAGRLRPVIGKTFPLSDAAGAHTAIENRAVIGKVLILP